TEKASSVQSSILYDCDAEPLSNSIRLWVQISRSSARYSAGSPKNCPKLEEVLSESRSACRGLSTSSW
ncbi:unnamed protein product, partial [Brassica rapa]